MVGLVHVLLGVLVNEECNSQHVAVSCLVANTLACCALKPGFEWVAPLIRLIVPVLGCSACWTSQTVAILIGYTVAMAREFAASMSRATIRAIPWGPIKPVRVGGIALNVTEGKFVIIIVIPRGVCVNHLMHLRSVDVPNPMFGFGMDPHRNRVDVELVGEVTYIIRMTISINTCLEGINNIGIFQRGNCLEEDVSAVADGEEDMLFGMEVEVK
jgi:hypothetical protein